MKDLCSKKAIAASLSLTLALGSVPAVALADDADENSEGATSEQSAQAELSFSANGGQFTDGSTGVTVKANEDGSINAPTPTRAGYTFKGWYSQSSMDGIPENYQQYYKLDPSSAKAGSWFAAWEKNAEVQAQSVEVVSFFQGGERDGSSVTTTIDVTADSSVADCVKSFEGYAPTKIVSGAATSEEEVNMTSSLEGITTLYVYYKADEQKTEQNQINVLYAANGGQFVDGNETMQGVADADGKLRQPPTPTRDGYTFAGWYWHADYSGYTDEQKAADKVDFDQAVTGQTVTMFAQWTKDEVQNETDVLYVANGGKFADGQEVQQGLTDSDGMMRQPMTPTRDGYTFAGWYWVSDLSGLTDEQKDLNKVDFSQSVAGKEHVTVFAQWTKNQEQNDHAVMYVANGGQFATGETFQQGVTDSDGMMRQPAAPTREGYTFDGWYWHADYSGYTDEQKAADKVDFSQPVQSDVNIYAQWTKNADQNEIDVLYAANGGQFATGETFQQGLTDSDGMMRQPAEPTREGYTFDGWYWVSDLSGLTDEQKDLNKVDFSQSVAGKEHVTVFAQWTKNQEQNDHAVMYVANGGQFATGETFQQGVTDSDGMMRQPAAPTREGYTFDGWYWHADYSGYTDEQKAADKVDFSQPVQSDVNIYAQWTKNADAQAEQITVKFVDNFNGTESSAEVKKGEAVAKPADPTYDGWTFEGWSSTLKDDEGNWEYTPVDFSKAVEDEDQDGVVTYYAFYSENQAAADDAANGEEAAEQEAAGDDAEAADESSIAPQTGDATNVAAVAGIGGIAGLLAAAAALLRRRRSN